MDATQTQLITAEMLEQMPQPDGHIELVKGELVMMPPAGHEHGEIAGSIFGFLRQFVRQHGLGKVYAAETGFILSRDPDVIRAPDAAFVTAERAAQQKRKEGFFDGPPDLAVEVVSPSDVDELIEEKVLDYLNSGVKLVWLIYPRTHTITAYRTMSDIRLLTAQDTLDGADVLPGFAVQVQEIFEG
jgi:Uma2 family endonuclease